MDNVRIFLYHLKINRHKAVSISTFVPYRVLKLLHEALEIIKWSDTGISWRWRYKSQYKTIPEHLGDIENNSQQIVLTKF